MMNIGALVLTLWMTLATAKSTSNDVCPKGVHIIVARESEAPQGFGIIGAVAQGIIAQIPQSDMESVVYPALLKPYIKSETTGIASMTALMKNYAKTCPDAKVVLMGYSQGAQVTSDVLCGASEEGFPPAEPIDQEFTRNVLAVVLMGDPSFTANQTYNVGTGKLSGIFPRTNPKGCDRFADRIMSVCDADDMFCQKGGKSLEVHLSYVENWGARAVEFVVSKFLSYQE